MRALESTRLEGSETEPTAGSGPGSHPEGHTHRPTSELVDAALLGEIELLADVIAATSAYPSHLTPEQFDAVLDVPSPPAAG